MKPMKLLIGYDGSESADAALAELERAGLPRHAEVVVLSVAEEWIPAPASIGGVTTGFALDEAKAEREARNLALGAETKLKMLFPEWDVRAESATGTASNVLIWKADEWAPDLIVVGSHGRSALGRFLFGSLSQKVLTEADAPVRIARASQKHPDDPVTLLVGVDGSRDANLAVQALSERHWPRGTRVCVVGAVGVLPSVASEQMAIEVEHWIAMENARVSDAVAAAVKKLGGIGLQASSLIEEEDPQSLLCRRAEELGADCIFVGARGMGRLERLLIGSVSSRVAARAHCSVEVVR